VHPAGDGRVELAEVGLAPRAGQMRLRDRHLPINKAELDPAASDVTRNRHLRHRRAVLGDQPLPNPASGMPLLLRCVLVIDQPMTTRTI
jgi:hypothetical protein